MLVLGVAVSGLVMGSPAQAATSWGCSGSEIVSPIPVTYSGTVYSYIHVFWNGYTNCAANVKTGSLYGVQTETDVYLFTCHETVPRPCTEKSGLGDAGDYYYYADVTLTWGTAGQCIQVIADTTDRNGNGGDYKSGAFACN